jgi:hypothetical protein
MKENHSGDPTTLPLANQLTYQLSILNLTADFTHILESRLKIDHPIVGSHMEKIMGSGGESTLSEGLK